MTMKQHVFDNRSLVPIHSPEDLKKVLFIQKSVTERAEREMLGIATDGVGNPKSAPQFIAEERKLLEKYAKYPTLSEFAEEPEALMNGTKWGATFGVTVLVGGLIIEELKRMQPHLEPVIRKMLMLMLDELNHPRHRYLTEPLERNMTITSKAAPDKAKAIKRQVCVDFANAALAVGKQYGLLNANTKGIILTNIGRRVFFHLVDAERFIGELNTAHGRLQSVKPKLSMS
jgi:hypothetical protein